MTSGGTSATRVVVEAPARLHFGMLDLRGSLGRRFGGIGAAVQVPSLLLEASRADQVEAAGPDAERACEFAHRVIAAHRLTGGVRLRVRRAIPPHAGLGSGTQLALAVARAVAELYALPTDVVTLAAATQRARRSAIGTWTFAAGGFILEGGRHGDTAAPAPILARFPMPSDWRCVIAVPRGEPGMSGAAEAAAFARLPPPSQAEVERVAHLVLMGILPAVAEGDLAAFGAALSEVQRVNGGWFAAAQGGVFAPGPTEMLVRRMGEWGAAGVGQSSWGPTA
ncbi:MAG TPA: beta-ribofuranosylaminobenzene 5'-phosphate synthase family protein, partial [Gemmatimonadaceae bacterium]|nr:beta-ribofuranosylaminobenzene 5'-phosphate synthase family protein [Gemmatimonadaceae bacterium]